MNAVLETNATNTVFITIFYLQYLAWLFQQ